VLRTDTLVDRDGVMLADVACRHLTGRGLPDEQRRHAIVFVRRGCFVRSAGGVESMLDPAVAYCMNPGEEERYDHPQPGGDDCTWLRLEPGLVATLAGGGDPALPAGPIPTDGEIDLRHRLLLAAGRRGADPHELVERAIAVAARVLACVDPRPVQSGRPATARARRRAADGVREALSADLERSLPDLARDVAVSPHHLSRVFHAVTGLTVSRYRRRLRARLALERLAGGDDDLAGLAHEVGFADQSHLCRVLRAETGEVPSAIRHALARPAR
jgi:AraC-like DNA-binding protein